MKKTILLLCGKKFVGKDTFANFFIKKNYVRIALADNLKFQLKEFFKYAFNENLDDSYFFDPEKKEATIELMGKQIYTVRGIMQWYGQIMKRKFGNDYWVKKLFIVNKLLSKVIRANFIVTDVRFPYEAEYIKKLIQQNYDIYTIKIERDTGMKDKDISETAFDGYGNTYYDFVVDNNKSLGILNKQAEIIHRKINN